MLRWRREERIVNLGEKLRHFRAQAGLTQAELAGLSRVDSSYISRIEKNDVKYPSYVCWLTT